MGFSGAQRRERIVIGLTGPIASGKSTVAAKLADRGAEIIDADQVYRSLIVPGSPLSAKLVARFGPGIERGDGEIDRAALGAIVFGDPAGLADLDRITHPAVVAEIRRRLARSAAPVVFIEAVKLLQSGLIEDVDRLWLVDADPDIRLCRLMARTGLDRAAAQQRLLAAIDPVPHGMHFDVTIDASGDREATARAVDEAWRSLRRGAPDGSHDRSRVAARPKEEP